MLPLRTPAFPATAAALASLLNDSVRRFFVLTGDPVSVQEDSYPKLQSLRVVLDSARLRPDLPRPPVINGERSHALHIQQLRLDGSRLSIGPATADVHITAHDVRFDQGRDSEKDVILILRSAAEGQVEITADKSELEKAITAVASREAGKQGITVEQVRLTVRERGTRGLGGEVQVKARKLFFRTVIRIAACLDLDEKLNANLSGLACTGDGAIGNLACGVLTPHLQKLEGRAFSLLALPLGDIRLRDVRLSASDKITVTANFGG